MNEAYIYQILSLLAENRKNTEYLKAVYTFAGHWPTEPAAKKEPVSQVHIAAMNAILGLDNRQARITRNFLAGIGNAEPKEVAPAQPKGTETYREGYRRRAIELVSQINSDERLGQLCTIAHRMFIREGLEE